MIGTLIGNYRVVEKLGEGGMGTVYKAIDTMLEREVALKILRPEFAGQPELAERFRTEAVILARLNHPHIATLYGLSREGDRLFMVMEFVRGETLEKLLERERAIPAARAVPWCGEALEAMEYAHRRGIVHRDIKPANLMLTEDGALKVMDFGIARVLGSAHQTRLGHVIGTASYMAPEQIRGQEVDGRTDIYALGIVLYQLVTGRPPFGGPDAFAIMTAQVTESPVPPSRLAATVPSWLDAAVMRAMAKAPGDRFQSAAEFRRALEAGLRTMEPEDDTRATATDELPDPALGLVPDARQAQSDLYATIVDPPVTREAEVVPPTRLAAVPPTRIAPPAAAPTTPRAFLDRFGWRGIAVVAVLALAVVLVPILWLAARSSPGPGQAGRQAASGETVSPAPAQASSSQPAARQEPTVGLPPENAAQRPVESLPPARTPRVPPAGREPVVVPPTTTPVPPAETKPAPTADTKAVPAEEPARTADEPATFEGLQLLVGDSSQVEVTLTLRADHLTIASDDTGATLKSVRYRSILGASYEETHEIKRQGSSRIGALKGALSKGGQLFGAGKHWLTLRTDEGVVVIRLGRGYGDIIPAFERLSGVKVK